MAHHQDYAGLYMTIANIRSHWPERLPEIQFVVIDQSPDSEDSNLVKGYVGVSGSGPAARECHSIKYVPYTERLGTSVSRNMIFDHADGEWVLVMDCHVILHDLPHVFSLIDQYPESKDIFSGPIQFDSLTRATHFDPVWSAEMWGKWSMAWTANGQSFCVRQGEKGFCNYHELNTQEKLYYPHSDVHFAGHEKTLQHREFIPLGYAAKEKTPFEIPGQGLGCFLVRKDAWLGFNEHALGFGGEELYIHEKYRQAGHKALCSPGLVWTHRFGRVGGAKYPLTQWNKCRNYVLEFNELGLDLEPVRKHFVDESTFPAHEWNELIKDPVNTTHPKGKGANPAISVGSKGNSCGSCGNKSKSKTVSFPSIEEYFHSVEETPRDINEHMQKLRELAASCSRILEFSIRRESTTAFMAGLLDQGERESTQYRELISVNPEKDHVAEYFSSKSDSVNLIYKEGVFYSIDPPSVKTVDLLFINQRHNYLDVYSTLENWGILSKRYIVLHNTDIYGETGQDGGPGILKAVRDYIGLNPIWSVIEHYNHQHGLTVLGCQQQDKPQLPGKWEMAKNFAKSLKNHAVDGFKKSPLEVMENRLMKCSLCDYRVESNCSVCGCNLELKASWKEQECPLGKWKE